MIHQPYFFNILSNRIHKISIYDLGISENFAVTFPRLCSYKTPFIPSTLKLLNEIDLDPRNCLTLSEFKANFA